MAEIDSLLQTVMFTIYGNQYESREEHLLLTMFQVRIRFAVTTIIDTNSLSLRINSTTPKTTRPSFVKTLLLHA
jgi:Ras GTPase-activating-like protein IQGAP2/3